MTPQQRIGLGAAAVLFLLLGFFLGREIGADDSSSENETAQVAPTVVATAAGETATAVDSPEPTASSVSEMTLEVKIGQMLMSGFAGTTTSADVAFLIDQYNLGNVVLFGPNVGTPDQVRALTDEIQQLAQEKNGGIPALISADQEGGIVTRLPASLGYTEFPDAAVLGCIDDPLLTNAVGRVMGEEMRAVGINMDLAPVLDVNDNPANPVIGVRAFGSTPTTVSTHGPAFIGGLQTAGVAATGKHYPGHGNTSTDSHLVLPTVNKSVEELLATELAPYAAALGRGNVDVIMTAHVMYPALDSENMATLSPAIVGRLRNDMGFGGVIMTDSMTMGAIEVTLPVGEASVQAVEAGVDLIALSSSAAVDPIYNSLLAAVNDGRISEERIDQSVERILALKTRLGLGPGWAGDLAVVNSADHQAVRQQVDDARVVAVC